MTHRGYQYWAEQHTNGKWIPIVVSPKGLRVPVGVFTATASDALQAAVDHIDTLYGELHPATRSYFAKMQPITEGR